MNNPTMRLRSLLSKQRSPDTIIALRNKQPLYLADFRLQVSGLIKHIESVNAVRWALCFQDSYSFAAALLAVLYCGKQIILPGHIRQKQLQEQASEYDAIVTDFALQLPCPIINIHETTCEPNQTDLPDWPEQQKDLILFTSGSTGKPKPINKPIHRLELEIDILHDAFADQLTNGTVVSTVSHQHLYGLTFRILLPLLSGIPFDANSIEYHEQLYAYPNHNIILIASPAFLKRLDSNLATIPCRMVFSAGGPLHFDHAQNVVNALTVLPQEIYGSSETGVVATRQQKQIQQRWQPFNQITISQHTDRSIIVDSPLFCADETQINDIIQLEENGFHLIGRQDRIIKIEEKRISLTEIEQRLTQLDEIRDAAVVTLERNHRIMIGAVIVLSQTDNPHQTLNHRQLTQHFRHTLRDWLEPVALPKYWRIVESIPLNQQGKRAYIELQELFL